MVRAMEREKTPVLTGNLPRRMEVGRVGGSVSQRNKTRRKSLQVVVLPQAFSSGVDLNILVTHPKVHDVYRDLSLFYIVISIAPPLEKYCTELKCNYVEFFGLFFAIYMYYLVIWSFFVYILQTFFFIEDSNSNTLLIMLSFSFQNVRSN